MDEVNMSYPTTGKKSAVNKMLKRMHPEVREEFLRDRVREERSGHIRTKDNGKYCVDLYLSKEVDGKYDSASADKEFNSFEEADQFIQKFFETNPEESNYTDVEE